MGEREHSLLSQKQELLKRRKQLLDIKLQLQKDIHITRPINFGKKYEKLSVKNKLSVADGLHHKTPDVRFLELLECHLLCGLKVMDYNESKMVVQFRPSYMEKILPEVYAVSLLAESNGYSVEKYYLPYSVHMSPVIKRWSPLRGNNLKNFFLDIKQQINAFHHRQNQILQLKEWANIQNVALKVFHPLSLTYIIVTVRMVDNLKFRNCRSLNLIFHYDSNCYLPTTVDIESSELGEEELSVAKEQFSAFKLYSLREAFKICCIKTERFSLSAKEDVPNEDLNEEDNDSTSVSEEEGSISDARNTAVSEQLRTPSQVNKENRLLPTVEKAKKSKSEPSTKEKRNRNRHNSSALPQEAGIIVRGTSEAARLMEGATKSRTKSSTEGESNGRKDSSSSVEEDDIAERGTSDASEKITELKLQMETKRSSGSVLQKAKKSKPTYSAKGARNVASKGESNTLQAKKQLKTKSKTDSKATKKKYSPDDAPHTYSTNKGIKEVPASLQTNKITRYLLRRKR